MNPKMPPAAEGLPETEREAPKRLSAEFQGILRETAGRAVTLGELEQRLKGRGFALFLLILSVPFCIPVSLPGLSVVFGFVIVLIGLRILLGRRPKLPGFILRREVQPATLERIVRLGVALCVRIERCARPRMGFLSGPPMALRCIGLGLVSGGLQLLLPLPPLIPLSNTIPAISIVLLTAGMIERDGVLVLCGYIAPGMYNGTGLSSAAGPSSAAGLWSASHFFSGRAPPSRKPSTPGGRSRWRVRSGEHLDFQKLFPATERPFWKWNDAPMRPDAEPR